ncbi:MAG: type II toxin-antitoxin system YafQ family toxin [Treponema sp.]|nr:type II toxin-antitoxin system YafQ family toxin [Treponema sp.]
MLTLKVTSQYRKDRKLAKKRGLDMELLDTVIQTLPEEKLLPVKHKDHALVSNFTGFRECHIQNDWLLVYKIDREQLILTTSRTGTHSDIFG